MRQDGTSNGFLYQFTDPDGEAFISLSAAARGALRRLSKSDSESEEEEEEPPQKHRLLGAEFDYHVAGLGWCRGRVAKVARGGLLEIHYKDLPYNAGRPQAAQRHLAAVPCRRLWHEPFTGREPQVRPAAPQPARPRRWHKQPALPLAAGVGWGAAHAAAGRDRHAVARLVRPAARALSPRGRALGGHVRLPLPARRRRLQTPRAPPRRAPPRPTRAAFGPA